MSVKLMAAVFEIEGGVDSSERLVLLALADHADDEGRCYPSISRLCRRTSLTDRGVQKVIARLVDKGFLSIIQNGGRAGSNLYIVTATPELGSPPEPRSPRTGFTTPPNVVPKTPEPRSPKPSRTIIEPSVITPCVPQPEKLPPKARLPEGWALSEEGWAYARSQQIPEQVIEDEARGFHAYWSDRRDRDASKSARGWEQCWATHCRRIASKYAQRGGMAGKAAPGGYGRGSSIASIAARRRAAGEV